MPLDKSKPIIAPLWPGTAQPEEESEEQVPTPQEPEKKKTLTERQEDQAKVELDLREYSPEEIKLDWIQSVEERISRLESKVFRKRKSGGKHE